MLILALAVIDVKAYSETFQLTSSLFPVTRSIELNKNEKAIGELHLYNLPTNFGLNVWIEDPNGNKIMDVLMAVPRTQDGTPIPSERVGEIEFSAAYSGIYAIKIVYVSPFTNIIVDAKLSYEIQNLNQFIIPTEIIYLIICLVAVPIISYIVYKAIKH